MKIPPLIRKRVSGFALLATSLAVAAPIIATFWAAIATAKTDWTFLANSGAQYARNTIFLLIMTGIGVSVVGVACAAFVSLTKFRGRRILSLALAAPFAVPAYVMAYAYGDIFGPFGLIASIVGAKATPEIRTLPGAAFILTLAAFPYVYLAMRASLATRSTAIIEAARTLGATPLGAFRRALLGASRPAFFGGLALALMEAAADYGVADYFGTPTLSVGIFRTWYGRGDLTAATQLALGLFLVALLFYIIEDLSRRGQFAENAKTARGHGAIQLRGWHEIAAICVCATPVILGFVIPVAVLIGNAMTAQPNQAMARLAPALGNTAFVALCGAAIAAILALGLAYGRRILNSRIMKSALRIATLGYAIPGAVIAIGLLALLNSSSILSGVTLISGVGVLIYAYVARFLTASFSITEAGLSQINRQVDSAAQTLGAGPMRIVREIHIPLMRRAILAGAAIVAIDIAKELPATLLLRPFNFETLSTQVYRLASDERLIEASPAALVLIFVGLAPVFALGRAETSRSIGP